MSFAAPQIPPVIEHGWRFHRRRPSSRAGTWSVRLVGGGLAFVVVVALFVALIGIHADVGPVSLLGVAAFAGLVTVIVGGVLAILAILRRSERSIVVLVTIPIWAIAVFVVVGELAVPH